MNPGRVPSQPQCHKNQIRDGRCRGAHSCTAPPQDCKSSCDQPDACDIGQEMLTREVFTQGLDGLMRGVEITPGNTQNAGESGAQAIEPNSNFHVLISHESFSGKPERNDDPCASRLQN